MEGGSTKGVLSQLSLLEVQARSRRGQAGQRSRLSGLKAEVEALQLRREQLEAEMETLQKIQTLRASMDKRSAQDEEEEEEEMDEDSEDSQLLRLMARHTQLKDLLRTHHLSGGYDVVKVRQGKGVCVSLATAYEGVYLETFNLEIDLKPKLRISRHNVPPFIPLNSLAKQSNMQTNMKTFLDTLSRHLNGFMGRKQQLKLVKELHPSVEVMERNVLCSILVMMFTLPRQKTAILCTMDYADHTRCLPTRVQMDCEDSKLPDSPEWKKNCSLLMETPVHKALFAMKKMGNIV